MCVCVYARTYQRYMLTIKSKILKYISRSVYIYIYISDIISYLYIFILYSSTETASIHPICIF